MGNKIYYIVGAIALAIIAFIYFSFDPKSYLDKIISQLVEQRQEQIIKDYKERIAAAEARIESAESKIAMSNKKIEKLKKDQKEIEDALAKITPPETSEDLRNRLRKLGVSPLN
jgi:peptidoglycan hydrolase CwlO-like protein